MADSRTDHMTQKEAARSSPPPMARLAIVGGVAAVLAGAVYLIAVRGEALLLDLSTFAGRVLCF